MRRALKGFRNVHVVIATAAGLTILVTGALGWLGWRLLSQEEALERQRSRDRLQEIADGIAAGFVSALGEAQDRLAAIGTSASASDTTAIQDKPGAILVLLSRNGAQTIPDKRLLYYPVTPAPEPLDERFSEPERLEFQSNSLDAAAAALSSLAQDQRVQTRAEALLRLARVQTKSKRIHEALATYARLQSVEAVSQAEVPYALLGRFARIQLMTDTGVSSADQAREAEGLLGDLHSGRWRLRGESYAFYTAAVQKLAGTAPASALADRIAISDAVGSLWEDWQRFQYGSWKPPARRIFSQNKLSMLLLTHVNSERLAALVCPAGATSEFTLKKIAGSLRPSAISVSIVDEHGRFLVGNEPAGAQMRATRTLAAAQLPWTLHFATAPSQQTSGVLYARRNYFLLGLAAVAAIVALACYAMSRGVIRELNATRLQSDFVSAVSHEFRSPLTTLRQLTELLACGRIQNEERRRLYFDVLQKETSRLHRLVENLLDFGRMEADRKQYSPEPLNLVDVVHQEVREYEFEIHGSGYSFEVGGDREAAPVTADREAIRRVVRNLLENAVKYSPDKRTVWVETASENGNAVLMVRDEGMGIAAAEQPRIFDKFVRGEAAKKSCIQGTGIGLAMVKEIVQAHNGQVAVRSIPGEGSTFTVRLPLRADENGSTA